PPPAPATTQAAVAPAAAPKSAVAPPEPRTPVASAAATANVPVVTPPPAPKAATTQAAVAPATPAGPKDEDRLPMLATAAPAAVAPATTAIMPVRTVSPHATPVAAGPAAAIAAGIDPSPALRAVAPETVAAPPAPAAPPKTASAPVRTRSLHASPVATLAAADITASIAPSP